MAVKSFSQLKQESSFVANSPIESRDFYVDLIDTIAATAGGGGSLGSGPFTVDVSTAGQATVTDTLSTESFVVSGLISQGAAFPAAVPSSGIFHITGSGLYRHDGSSWVQV